MRVDRRSSVRGSGARRACDRLPVFEEAKWKALDDRSWRKGFLVSVSGAGLALLTNQDETPSSGDQIQLRLRTRVWQRPARVIRIDHVSGTMDLVAAEFRPEATPTPQDQPVVERMGRGGGEQGA